MTTTTAMLTDMQNEDARKEFDKSEGHDRLKVGDAGKRDWGGTGLTWYRKRQMHCWNKFLCMIFRTRKD